MESAPQEMCSLAALDLNDPVSGGWKALLSGTTDFYKGMFTYKMTIFDDTGQSLEIEGAACSIVCDSDAAIFQTKEGCLFPANHDGEGGTDASFPTYEDDCFGG